MIVVAWSGFIVAVIAGILEGLLVIVIGFALIWFVTSMVSTKAAVATDESTGSIAPDGTVEPPMDVQARVRQRLEQMSKEHDAPGDEPEPSEP
jgi:hypothetical protein